MSANDLHNLLDMLSDEFKILSIHNEQRLSQVRQTAFTWTRKSFSLCLGADRKYLNQALANSHISAVICPPSVADAADIFENNTIIVAENAAELFYRVHNSGVHRLRGCPDHFVETSTGNGCTIGKSTHIGDHVKLGNNVSIGPGCYIGSNSIIEDNVEIGPNTIIGVDGLFSKNLSGEPTHIKHYGGVKISRNCKLHASILISRSVNYGGYTTLEPYVHVGHKSIIGHDATIGEKSTISVGVTLAGRVIVEESCWIGAGAKVSNTCRLGAGSRVRIGAVVIQDVPPQGDISGNFATSHQKNLHHYLTGIK